MFTRFAFISLLFCLVTAQVTAVDETHWSFRPLGRVDVPSAGTKRWARTPVDAFISARQEGKGLSPSPEASPTKLARRMYFDLVGLPPTPEQVEDFRTAFSQDAPGAVESL